MANSPSHPESMDKSDAETKGAATATDTKALLGDNADQANATFDFLRIVQVAEERDQMFKGAIQKNRWRRALDAFHSRHSEGTRYADPNWRRKRSAVYRPRTRANVRKNMAALAASLFTSPDSVSVQSEIKDNPTRAAAAAVLQECLNYRLDRTAARSGVPWFLITSGAAQDAQITGICYTKQFWEYEVVTEKAKEITVRQQYYTESGEPVVDPQTGEPVTEQEEKQIEKEFVTKDRPQSLNLPPENVVIDPTAYWINPEQRSAYLILKFPMTEDDATVMLDNPGKSNEEWLDVPDAILRMVMEDYTSKGVRTARAADGVDALDNRGGANGVDKPRHNIVWLYECFIRVQGVDYHFWSLGSRAYASKVRTTRQAYPEQRGERPVTRGYAQIETHETHPESPVTSWMEIQRELNDIVNLRLDTMKQALSPIAKVKQGTIFDFKALQNRAGENTTVIVRNMDDLQFDRTPDVGAAAYQETSQLNADFDDLASVFQPSSVDTNRRLNETVGGMQLMQTSANAVGEFDTRTMIETWAEPTLRQIVRLEQYYETDEVVLAVAGERAKLEKFGLSAISDTDLDHEVTVRVNAGLGSADPMQKMAKLSNSVKILMPMFPMFDKMVRVNSEETIKEVMGLSGYHDGLRFFHIEDGPPPPLPAVAKMQMTQMVEEGRKSIARGRDQTTIQREHMREQATLLQEIIKQYGAQLSSARGEGTGAPPPAPPKLSVNFKDLPVEAQAEALAQIGIFVHPDTLAAHMAAVNTRGAGGSGVHGPSIGPSTSLMTQLLAMLAPPNFPPDAAPLPPPPGPGGPGGMGGGPGAGGPPPQGP